MRIFKRIKWSYVVLSAMFLLLGIYLVVNPETSLIMICRILGAAMAVFGVMKIVLYFIREVEGVAIRFDFAVGLFCIILGVLMLWRAPALTDILSVMIGLLVLVDSVFKLQVAVDSRRMGAHSWWVTLVCTVVCLVLGILLVFNPFDGKQMLTWVILPPDFHHPLLNDSKKMSEKSRETLRPVIEREAVAWAVEAVSPEEIDNLNILWASVTGMQRAVRRLDPRPDFLLIDGNRFRPFDGYGFDSYRTVVHGDATYSSIAAASVLAKTWRDERMRQLAKDYPEYGWDRNMGYPTKEHIEAIRKYGLTPWHRRSFHPKELEPTLFSGL